MAVGDYKALIDALDAINTATLEAQLAVSDGGASQLVLEMLRRTIEYRNGAEASVDIGTRYAADV